ncbi:uncharacterized protein V1513DRAFT_435443 [Lipomyces chichibuensis]|uniref:uncharacterized protein n=1 Tax=Lipomyces chichibuensis TaxID=1546026 RepID=UPI0033435758
MDRKAPRHSRLSHTATPYSRPSRQSSLPNGETPQTPMRGREDLHTQTPGSIFSKVISMFTPSRWNSPRHQQHSDGELHTSDTQKAVAEKSASGQSNIGGSDEQGAESGQCINTPTRFLPFLFSPAKSQPPNTPAWSLAPLALTPTQMPAAPSDDQTASPNQMLANFFREKGDAPLSSIEVQGVMALMHQAQQKQLDEHRQSTPSLPSFSTQTSPSKTVTEQLYPSVPSFVTPARHRSATPSLRAPRYNPILTPQPRRAATPTVAKPKTVVQYPTISTPFKSRTTTPQPSSGKRLKTDSDVPAAEKPERKQLRPASPATQHDKSTTPSTAPKRISQTASALLSLIEPVGTPSEIAKARAEDRERLTDPAIKSFVNPYAASAPLASTTTRRKLARKESLVGVESARKKRRALDEIERTIPTEEKVGAFASGIASATPVKPSTHAVNAHSAPKVSSTTSARPEGDSQIAISRGAPSASKQTPSSISLIDKFKPSKSSHLRESIIMNAQEIPGSDNNVVEKKSVQPEPSLALRADATSKVLFPFGSSGDSTPANEQKKSDTIAFAVREPAVSQSGAKPDEKNIPFSFGGGSATPRIATPVPATDVSTQRSESEKKALSTNDYMAYLPRFFFSGPASVEVSGGNDDVKQKARDAPEKAFQDYKFRFTFPDVSSAPT